MVEAKVTRDYKKREHRYSKLTVADLLRTRMDELNIKNIDMQAALGYPQANVIAMMKMGSMRLPASKAVEAARLLQIDPAFLLMKLLQENEPALWDAFQTVTGNRLITDNELTLIHMVREELDGFDADLAGDPNVQAALKPVLHNLSKSNVTDLAKHKAAIDKEKAKKTVTK